MCTDLASFGENLSKLLAFWSDSVEWFEKWPKSMALERDD